VRPGKDKNFIRLSKCSLSSLEKKAVLKVLNKEFLGMGEEVSIFENNLTKFFGRKSVCLVNGTAALQLALQAIGIKSGDEVLVPSLTYVSNFQSITANNAKPIPCDIYPDSLLIDLSDAEKKLTKNTKAIMPVHYAGGVGNLNDIYKFAKKNNLRVIEDASHAFGSKYKNKLIGSQGDIVCFSFDGIKNITSGEGGCLVTNDTKILNTVEDIRLLGVNNDSQNRVINKRSWTFDVFEQGWRYHMSNIMAAIGIVQLNRFSFLSKKRQSLAMHYDKKLSGYQVIQIFKQDYTKVVPHIYPIRIINLTKRKKLQNILSNKGIQTGVHYYPNHYLSYFKKHNKKKLLITENIFPELLTLPLHPDLKKSDIVYIVNSLLEAINELYD
jgi:dTDP-4-amino-4,6-dideoxygalactose transaminase